MTALCPLPMHGQLAKYLLLPALHGHIGRYGRCRNLLTICISKHAKLLRLASSRAPAISVTQCLLHCCVDTCMIEGYLEMIHLWLMRNSQHSSL